MVEKKRWRVHDTNNHIWDLDQFLGLNEGLWLAEIELESEDELYDWPKWVGNDVTGDNRFTSKQLARHPFTEFIDIHSSPNSEC
jgi:CYTH domain-containing protein